MTTRVIDRLGCEDCAGVRDKWASVLINQGGSCKLASMEYSQGEASNMEYFQREVCEESEYLLQEYETQYEEKAKENE